MDNINDEFKEIGRRIRMIRVEKGMNQVALAKSLGIAQTHMSNIENGRSHISLTRLFDVAKALDCNIVAFFEDKKDKTLPGDLKLSDLEAIGSLLKLIRK